MHSGKKGHTAFLYLTGRNRKNVCRNRGEFLAACAQRGRDKLQRYSAAFGMVRSVKSLLKKIFSFLEKSFFMCYIYPEESSKELFEFLKEKIKMKKTIAVCGAALLGAALFAAPAAPAGRPGALAPKPVAKPAPRAVKPAPKPVVKPAPRAVKPLPPPPPARPLPPPPRPWWKFW